MDTKDKDTDLASPGVMPPDTTLMPLETELVATTTGDGVAAVTAPGAKAQKTQKSPTPLQDSLRRLRRDKRAMVSLGIILLFIAIPMIGPPIYQHIGAPYHSDLNGILGPQL